MPKKNIIQNKELELFVNTHKEYSYIPLRDNDKSPLIKWEKYQTSHPTPDELKKWQEDGRNLGVITGRISSNLVVLDIDFYTTDKTKNTLSGKPFDDSLKVVRKWVNRYLHIPNKEQFLVKTASGGLHVYMVAEVLDEDTKWDGVAKIDGDLFPVEVKAGGSYVVAPYSKGIQNKQKVSGDYIIIHTPSTNNPPVIDFTYVERHLKDEREIKEIKVDSYGYRNQSTAWRSIIQKQDILTSIEFLLKHIRDNNNKLNGRSIPLTDEKYDKCTDILNKLKADSNKRTHCLLDTIFELGSTTDPEDSACFGRTSKSKNKDISTIECFGSHCKKYTDKNAGNRCLSIIGFTDALYSKGENPRFKSNSVEAREVRQFIGDALGIRYPERHADRQKTVKQEFNQWADENFIVPNEIQMAEDFISFMLNNYGDCIKMIYDKKDKSIMLYNAKTKLWERYNFEDPLTMGIYMVYFQDFIQDKVLKIQEMVGNDMDIHNPEYYKEQIRQSYQKYLTDGFIRKLSYTVYRLLSASLYDIETTNYQQFNKKSDWIPIFNKYNSVIGVVDKMTGDFADDIDIKTLQLTSETRGFLQWWDKEYIHPKDFLKNWDTYGDDRDKKAVKEVMSFINSLANVEGDVIKPKSKAFIAMLAKAIDIPMKQFISLGGVSNTCKTSIMQFLRNIFVPTTDFRSFDSNSLDSSWGYLDEELSMCYTVVIDEIDKLNMKQLGTIFTITGGDSNTYEIKGEHKTTKNRVGNIIFLFNTAPVFFGDGSNATANRAHKYMWYSGIITKKDEMDLKRYIDATHRNISKIKINDYPVDGLDLAQGLEFHIENINKLNKNYSQRFNDSNWNRFDNNTKDNQLVKRWLTCTIIQSIIELQDISTIEEMKEFMKPYIDFIVFVAELRRFTKENYNPAFLPSYYNSEDFGEYLKSKYNNKE